MIEQQPSNSPTDASQPAGTSHITDNNSNSDRHGSDNAENKQPRFSPAARRKSRRYLLQALYQWQITSTALPELVPQYQGDTQYHEADNQYFVELITNITNDAGILDDMIRPFLDREPKSLDFIEHAILWIGSYELKERLDIPYKVIINEAIELAKAFGADQSHKYVNGILDRVAKICREAETDRVKIAQLFMKEDQTKRPPKISITRSKLKLKPKNEINLETTKTDIEIKMGINAKNSRAQIDNETQKPDSEEGVYGSEPNDR